MPLKAELYFFIIVLHVFVLKFHVCDEPLPCAVRFQQTRYLTISTYQHVDRDWGNQVQAEQRKRTKTEETNFQFAGTNPLHRQD